MPSYEVGPLAYRLNLYELVGHAQQWLAHLHRSWCSSQNPLNLTQFTTAPL